MKKLLFFVFCTTSVHAQWLNIGPGGQSLSSVSFYDAGVGFACGSAGSLYRTMDGGTTWASINSFQTPGLLNRLRAVALTSRTTVLVVWETPNQLQPTGSFLSTNSGNVFGLQDYGSFVNMSFRTPGIGLQVGGGGTLRLNQSNGFLWKPVASGTQQTLRDCDCPTPTDCFVAGDNGTVRKNVNGDLYTWKALNSTTSAQLNGVFFVTPARGYVVGNGGTALRTLDGGTSWLAMPVGTSLNLNDVWFLDANTGFVAGDFGTVLLTTDGGATWRSEATNTFENLNSISSVGSSAATSTTWIAGEGGTVLKRGSVLLGDRVVRAANGWRAYPNPFSTTLAVDLPQTGASPIIATLVDALGRIVFTQDLTDQPGRTGISLEVPAAVHGGVYWLQLRAGTQLAEVRRVVKMP